MLDQGWIKKEERIRCLTPLPEDSADLLLTRMLVPAPYQVPTKEDKEESKKAQGGPRSRGMPRTSSGEIGTPSSKDEREGETDIPSPHGKKRTASEDLKIKASKRGKISLSGGSGSGGDIDTQSLRENRPSAES